MYDGKLYVTKDTRGFLKWFGVGFSPTSTVVLLLPTIRKGYTHSVKFSKKILIEKKILAIGGLTLFIHPYDKYFNIKPHYFMSNQRICG